MSLRWSSLLALLLVAPAAAQTTPTLRPYYGGVLLAAQYWRGTYVAPAGKQVEMARREVNLSGEGMGVDHHLEMRCAGSLRCYGEILAIAGDVADPGGIAGDSIRVSNPGSGYAIGRKTAVRGSDRYGSWGLQINLSRAHAGIAIAGDGSDADRTMMGVWISEHVAVTDAAIRYNQRPGATGWAIKMLASDGKVYGIDHEGVLHVRAVKMVP